MQFNSLEEFYNYLADHTETHFEEPTEPSNPTPFDNNSKALNVLFRNAMNSRDFSTAFGIIAYANEHVISLTKGN